MIRHYGAVDTLTGCELLLSDASYNMACDWLENWFKRWNWEILEAKQGEIKSRKVTIIKSGKGKQIRNFYYDEERGYLLAG